MAVGLGTAVGADEPEAVGADEPEAVVGGMAKAPGFATSPDFPVCGAVVAAAPQAIRNTAAIARTHTINLPHHRGGALL